MKASTIDAAYQFFEENRKGSFAVGKLADMIVLEKNPLKVSEAELKDLVVNQTYKEGQLVWEEP